MVVFGSASFVEDHSECSVIQGILLFIVFQTVSPYTAVIFGLVPVRLLCYAPFTRIVCVRV